MSFKTLASVLTLGLLTATLQAQPPSSPYTVDLWATLLFDESGQARSVSIRDASDYPPALLEAVQSRLAQARIPPVQALDGSGRAATFQSGVRVRLAITPGSGHSAEGDTGQVRIAGVRVEPMPSQRYAASYPQDIARSAGWQGRVTARCPLGTDGRCGPVQIEALPGMPESVRRWARASLEAWTFEPQRIDGQPVPGEVQVSFALETLDSQPQDFRQPKWDRLMMQR